MKLSPPLLFSQWSLCCAIVIAFNSYINAPDSICGPAAKPPKRPPSARHYLWAATHKDPPASQTFCPRQTWLMKPKVMNEKQPRAHNGKWYSPAIKAPLNVLLRNWAEKLNFIHRGMRVEKNGSQWRRVWRRMIYTDAVRLFPLRRKYYVLRLVRWHHTSNLISDLPQPFDEKLPSWLIFHPLHLTLTFFFCVYVA